MEENKIIIYQTEDGQTQIDVRLENETVWLTQAQMAELFEKTPQNITMHIGNAYKEGELERDSTCKEYLQVQREGKRSVSRKVKYYDLDVIISVGYRVHSKRGTAFRIWARNIIKDYLVKGYAANERIRKEQIGELRQPVGMIGRTIQNKSLLSNDETNALFGNEKDDSFKSSIGQIYQTFGGEELYPSVEEKAAMLLYLVTKNHSFSDGNKRIAATLFLWFLNNNHILYREDGSKRLADNTLVALTLMIAESKTEEKDVMVKVVVNLINQRNE